MTVNRVALVVLGIVVLAGCSHAPPPPPPQKACTAPAWVCEFHSGACPLPELKGSICAVGSATSRNQQAGRREVELQARSAMMRFLRSEIDSWAESVLKTLSDAEAEEFNKAFGNVEKDKLFNQSAVGIGMPKYYFDPSTSTHYALAVLDAKALDNALAGAEKAKALNEAIRKRVIEATNEVRSKYEADRDRATAPAAAAADPAPAAAP